MPLYDYACDSCGPFRDWRPMSVAGQPADCPDCGDPAQRRISAPFLANMPANNRIAHQRNEKSADEPQVRTRQQLDQTGTKRGHAHGHHHHGHGRQHQASRPWMIGH